MDQAKLLRALDRVNGANFGRIQITSTINRQGRKTFATAIFEFTMASRPKIKFHEMCFRVVENVRPNLDAVVIHIGNQELLDASHSAKNSASGNSKYVQETLDKKGLPLYQGKFLYDPPAQIIYFTSWII